MMGGNGVTNIPGVSGGSGVSDGTGVAGVGGTQTLGLNFLSGALDPRISFTRATPATVTDFEGLIKTVKSGEVRFDGMRRVENLLSTSETLSTQSVTVIAGTYAFTLGATSTGSVTFSGASTGTLAGNGANRKYITLTTTEGSLTITVTGSVLQAQLENVTGTNRKVKAVQTGGPSGGCIPAELFNTPVDYESLSGLGAIIQER